MSVQTSRIGVLPTLSLTALTVITAVSCRGVFADWEFLPLLLGVALATHAVMAGCRALRVPLLAATPLAALVTAAIIGREMYGDTIRYGVLPTRSTWDLAWLDLQDACRQFPTAVAPVPSANGFLLGAALAIAVVAYTSDTFGFRAFGRVEAVVPSGVVFTFVAALGKQDEVIGIEYDRVWSAVIWLFAACLSVALLRNAHGDLGSTWLGGRRRERMLHIAAAAGALSLITVGIAYAVAPRLPGAGAAALIDPGSSDTSDVNVQSPIVDIRARLVNRSNRVLFRVKADEASYWHLTSLPKFTGERWESSETFGAADGDLGTTPLVGGTVLDQTFTIDQMGDGWVPAAHEAVNVETSDNLVYNQATSTLRVSGDGDLYSGMTYQVTSVLPDFSAEALRSATVANPPDPQYLELPADFPQTLRTVAASIVEQAPTPYDRALALQDFFQDNFEYDANVSRGHDEGAIQTLLNQRRGYCEQFAGTFAAFGRAVGLPTRVAIGFTPGVVENGSFVVRGRNAHAWPEVWFDGLGWVLFEPTPSRGAPGSEGYTGVAPAQDEGVGVDNGPVGLPQTGDEPVPTTPRSTVPRVGSVPSFNDIPGLGPVPTTATTSSGSGLPTFVTGLVAVLVGAVLWLLFMPRAVGAWTRRRRGHTPADRVTTAWREAAIALGVVGAGRKPSETPIEHAERAWKITGIDRTSLRSLASAATRAVYDADTLDDETALHSEEIRHEVTERVKARAPWTTRLRARLDPRTARAFH